ncbi:DNA polymerase I [Clostridium sp. CAG:265]|uniref:DNA polymerase I n=1 Tax=Clostridium sp. CAG:265 TaxID=1262787 RepID=UPI00033CFB30|nr:DNA polymerase I [Clostridium sp. CAG:265]CDB75818.1 dNA polymerase [Clostridium sp. CAG:265]
MEKLLIIDSESLMKRAFYAIPNMSNEESLYTNAIYGFTKMLFHIKKKIQPNLMASVLNSIGENIPKVLCEQKPYIKEILENASAVIYEEDDIDVSKTITSLVNDGRKKSMEIYIATSNKTLLQLIDDNVKVIYVESGINNIKTYDKTIFIEEYGIEPMEYIDVLALKRSNCFGEKTALSLIKTYGSLEGIIENSEKINSSRIRKVIEENKESVLLNKKLISLNGNEEGITLVNDSKDYNEEELTRIFKELNLSSLLEVLGIENIDDVMANEEIKVIDKLDDFKCFIKTIKERIYITYETSNSNVYSKIRVENMYICNGDESVKIDLSSLYEENISETNLMLKEFMENDDIKKVVHDGKNLLKALSKDGTQVNGFDFDSAIAAYLIDSARDKYNLNELINEYLEKNIDEKTSSAIKYLSELYVYLKGRIKEEGMEELYYNVEHPLIGVLSSMEVVGFNVNEEILESLAVKFKEEIKNTEKEIYDLCEEEFNISSPKQLGKILFEKLDLPVIKKTKTGYSTNADVLEKLKDKHPVIKKIIYYRQITKLNSTYVEGLKNVIDVDGRIHSSFNQTVTTTGRLSSTEPNLQNIPVKYEMGREIRKVFIPREKDDILLSCDYSQIELRVLAHMSDDANMIDAFKHHSDIHTKTAAEVFKVPVEEVTSLMRSRAKAVNFGIVYGISDFSLSQDLKITRKEAAEYMAIYFDRYPKIKDFLQGAIDSAKEDGYVLTLLNRRRFIPEIKSSNKIVISLGERLAMNAPIQGSAADIIKLAMVKVYERLKKEGLASEIILQVHDELILNVKPNELEKVKTLVIEEMENVFKLSVPLDVDVNLGKNWYEAK